MAIETSTSRYVADKHTSPFLKTPAAAQWLGITTRFLERLRETGEGPEFVKLSPRLVLYEKSALNAWIAKTRHCHRAGA